MHVNIAALAIFLALLASLVVIAAWMLLLHAQLGLLTILFASSIAIVYLASTTGYFDHILLLLAIITILPSSSRVRLALTLVLGVIAILIHEAAALMILPLMYFALFLSMRVEGTAQALLRLSTVVACHAALTLYISFFVFLDERSVDALQRALQTRADFTLAILAFEILERSAGDEMQRAIGTVNAVAHIDSLIIVAPSLLPMLLVLWAALRQLMPGYVAWALSIAACLGPSTLRFVATDIHRWDAISVCTSFLTLFVVLRELPPPSRVGLFSAWVTPALAMMIVVSASTTTFMFRDQDIRLYPFFPLRSALIDLFDLQMAN
jgi:hypothetical protein